MARRTGHVIWGLAIGAVAALALPSGASAVNTCAFDAGSGGLTVTHSIDALTATILAGLNPAEPGQTLIGVSPNDGTCPTRTGVEVTGIKYTQASGVSDLVISEPAALRRGAGTLDPAAEIPVDITDPDADGTLVHIVLRDGDGLPEHWVFSSNGSIPSAPMAVNTNASEPDPDFDVIMANPAFATFVAVGSPGADVIDASGGTFSPHRRPIEISGLGGADALTGGTRDDTLDGGPGDDAIDGGDGSDLAAYQDSTLPVSIDLAAAGPQDAGSLGRDTLASIESLEGGAAGDVLRGGAGNGFLDGGLGDDVLEGRGGDDGLSGDAGSDTASYASAAGPVTLDLALAGAQATGGAGTDTLDQIENATGGQGADVLRGTSGPNTLEGGPGADTMLGLEGDDVLLARDGGPDTVNCGPGNDRALVDPGGIDATTGCESVSVGVAAGLPGAAGTGSPASRRKAAASLKGPRTQRLVRGALTLRLACPVLSCAARVTASTRFRLGAGPKKHRVTLLPARARILAGKSALLRLKLAPKGLAKVRAALAAGRRPVVKVTVVVTDAAAAKRTLHRSIALSG